MDCSINKLVILGSTGSVGQQTLDIIRAFSSKFRIIGLAGGMNIELLKAQIAEFEPEMVYSQLNLGSEYSKNNVSMEQMASHQDVDLVVMAVPGKVGILPTLAALRAGKTVALASKEVLVMAGEIVLNEAKRCHARLNPIDSEHSAIWQCLKGEKGKPQRILLTASGGPFYYHSSVQLSKVTVDEALQHPVWNMGSKISIDSATLMNKGLEAIEAHWLFAVPFENIEILLHPQCIIHSMVEFKDGSIKAQVGFPDMRLPIQYALCYPQRLYNPVIPHLDFSTAQALTFESVDIKKFPCLRLAFEAGKQGRSYPAVLCAADEIAVELFLSKQIDFSDIATLIEETLQHHQVISNPDIDDILQVDSWAREYVQKLYYSRPRKYGQWSKLPSGG
jgi:1-deoxy-D-xylulose-5-phosphate reductoisomerase